MIAVTLIIIGVMIGATMLYVAYSKDKGMK